VLVGRRGWRRRSHRRSWGICLFLAGWVLLLCTVPARTWLAAVGAITAWVGWGLMTKG